jgi:hypothetical protein
MALGKESYDRIVQQTYAILLACTRISFKPTKRVANFFQGQTPPQRRLDLVVCTSSRHIMVSLYYYTIEMK